MFLLSRKPISLCRTTPNTLIRHIFLKNRMRLLKSFDKNNGLSLSKNANFVTFLNRCFYSLQRLFIYLQRHKTLLFAFSSIKKTNDKDYNFWEKPWTDPFGKMQTLRLFSNRCFHRLKSLFLYLERH